MQELINKIVTNKEFKESILKDNYKMKCLKWYHRLHSTIYSIVITIKYFSLIVKAVLKYGR